MESSQMRQVLETAGFVLAIVALMVGVWQTTVGAWRVAHAQTTIGLSVLEVKGYQHVLETGDMMIFIRYELPVDEWRITTYMRDFTCDDIEDFTDPCYTSLKQGAALHTFFPGAVADVDLAAVRHLPRVGFGLSAVYLVPGHGLNFGDTTYLSCIEGSATLFAPVPRDCNPIEWRTSADLETTLPLFAADITQITLNLEGTLEVGLNQLVDSGGITDTGRLFDLEAFSPSQDIVPESFFTGVGVFSTPFAPTPGAGSLETTIAADAAASTVFIAATGITNEYFGVSVRTLGGGAVLLVALIVFVGTLATVKGVEGSAMGALFGALVIGLGFYMGFVPAGIIFASLAIVVVLGLMTLYRRVPA